MNVSEWMTLGVVSCCKGDSLERAAQIMWDHDCGSVPVVDDEGRVEGVVTDRDVAMSAYTNGRGLASAPVERAMSGFLCVCGPDDAVDEALDSMARHQLHRLPVVDDERRIVGILSLADVVQRAIREDGRTRRDLAERVLQVLAEVTRPRHAQEPLEMPARRRPAQALA